MARYRWTSAGEWLDDRITALANQARGSAEGDPEAGVVQLVSLARLLASKLDGDTIQDALQSEMDEDGFFVDLDEREDKISRLPRERCVELLEGAGIECGDDPVEVLRAAVLVNVSDGTIDDSELES